MESLLDKYRKGELTVAELHDLRGAVNRLEDEELAVMLERCDSGFMADQGSAEASLSDEEVNRMERRCLEDAGIIAARRPARWFKPVLWAAAVMVPLLMVSTVYLFMESRNYRDMTEKDISIMTGEGERVRTVLPDGTSVELNYSSELRYTLSSFNDHERSVTFDGEGFFEVVRNDDAPFSVFASGLEVTVHGTSFNLQARKMDDYAELYLERGSVALTSCSATVTLSPGQKARLSYATGDIEVSDAGASAVLSWRTDDLLFHNETLENVIRTLAANYNYRITLDVKGDVSGRFTGRIPSNNLNEALDILECTYHLEAHIDRRSVTLTD